MAGLTARVDVAHGIPRELHNTGRICDILFAPDHQNLRELTPILADISLTHHFVGNAVDREQLDTHQTKSLCQRAQMKCLKHAWAESNPIVVLFVSDTPGSMSGESAMSLFLFAWCQVINSLSSSSELRPRISQMANHANASALIPQVASRLLLPTVEHT